jgi:hypothetical protein
MQATVSEKVEKVTACWLQHANIIFLFYFVDNRNTHRMAELTGVKEQTLSGWLSKRNDD